MLFIFILICAEDVKMMMMMMFLLFLLYSGSSLKNPFHLKLLLLRDKTVVKL